MAKLDYMTEIAREMFDIMDVDERNGEKQTEDSCTGEILGESYSDNKVTYSYPNYPTLTPAELCFSMIYFLPILLPFGLHAPGNTANNEMLRDSEFINTSPPNFNSNMITKAKEQAMAPTLSPSPPSNPPQTVSAATIFIDLNLNMMPGAKEKAMAPPLNVTTAPPPPPAPMPMIKGAAPPPPPPLGVAKALRPKKAKNKLRRSTHMGNLYRILKGKLEGSSSQGKNSKGRKSAIGGSTGGKQGMADALAEMTKRFTFPDPQSYHTICSIDIAIHNYHLIAISLVS